MKFSVLWIGGMLLATTTSSVQSGMVLTPSALGPFSVVDFSQFGYYTRSAGPIEIGGLVGESITFTSTTPNSVVGTADPGPLGIGSYGLPPNGVWGVLGMSHAGVNASNDSMTFTFNDRLVSGVGGFLNYAPHVGSLVLVEALDSLGAVLESYDIFTLAPISTPGGINAGEFRGILRGTSDIAAFRVSNAYIVLDDLTFSGSPTAVPEPASITMFSIGALGLVFALRKRRKMKLAA